jgi:hypothetical protein
MSLVQLVGILGAAGAGWLAVLAVVFLFNPPRGLVMTDHTEDQLPRVMTDRYLFFAALAFGAVWLREPRLIAFVFGGFAFLGFADAFIYARVGKPIRKHVVAGIASSIIAVLALIVELTGA